MRSEDSSAASSQLGHRAQSRTFMIIDMLGEVSTRVYLSWRVANQQGVFKCREWTSLEGCNKRTQKENTTSTLQRFISWPRTLFGIRGHDNYHMEHIVGIRGIMIPDQVCGAPHRTLIASCIIRWEHSGAYHLSLSHRICYTITHFYKTRTLLA